MRQQIPNIITLLNLFLGCLAIVSCFQFGTVASISESGEMLIEIPEKLYLASLFIGLAAVVDFFDGYVARLLNVPSEMGKQLDSLADVVSFGVLPSVIVFQLFKQSGTEITWLPYLAFSIAVFSALRLAKFNVDTRQAENFIGLPTPANALLLGSFPLIIASDELGIGAVIQQPHVLAIFCVLMSGLLVSEIPLFSLKFKQLDSKENKFRIGFIILSLILFLLLKFAAVPFIIGVYILLSMIQTQLKK